MIREQDESEGRGAKRRLRGPGWDTLTLGMYRPYPDDHPPGFVLSLCHTQHCHLHCTFHCQHAPETGLRLTLEFILTGLGARRAAHGPDVLPTSRAPSRQRRSASLVLRNLTMASLAVASPTTALKAPLERGRAAGSNPHAQPAPNVPHAVALDSAHRSHTAPRHAASFDSHSTRACFRLLHVTTSPPHTRAPSWRAQKADHMHPPEKRIRTTLPLATLCQ
jgi:hypothetical protein